MSRRLYYLFVSFFLTAVTSNSQNNHLLVGQIPPDISFISYSTANRIALTNRDFRGTVYLLDFWATWCSPCIASIPHMDSLIALFRGRNVKFISITYEPKHLVEKFLIRHPMNSEIGLDKDFKMFQRYNAWAIPNIVMINAEGKVAGRIHPNKLSVEIIKELIEGKIPEVERTPEDLYDPKKAEEYFRTLMNEEQNHNE